jgi:hypothetical protein
MATSFKDENQPYLVEIRLKQDMGSITIYCDTSLECFSIIKGVADSTLTNPLIIGDETYLILPLDNIAFIVTGKGHGHNGYIR